MARLEKLDEDGIDEEISIDNIVRLAECGLHEMAKPKMRSTALERELMTIIPDKFICGIRKIDGVIKFKRYESTMDCAEMIYKTTEKWPTTPRIVISPPHSPSSYRIHELRKDIVTPRSRHSSDLSKMVRIPEVPKRVIPPIDLTKITRIMAHTAKSGSVRDSVSDVDTEDSVSSISRTNSSDVLSLSNVSISHQSLKEDNNDEGKPALSRHGSDDSNLIGRMHRVRMIKHRPSSLYQYQKDIKVKEFHLKGNIVSDEWMKIDYIFSNTNIAYEVYMYIQRSLKGNTQFDDSVEIVRLTLQTR